MKRIIERITSTAMLAVAFMLCATSAWAITKPLAVWNGEFKANDASHGGDYAIKQYTYNHTIADNTLTINSTSSAGFISQATGKKNNKYMTLPFSAVVGFSDMPLPAEGGLNSLITVETWTDSAQQNANNVGIGLTSVGKFKGIATGSAWDSGGESTTTYSARSDGYWSYVALAYKGASGGTDVYYNGNTSPVFSKSNLKAGADTCYRAITIGGIFGGTSYLSTGMQVHYVALVPSNNTTDIAYWSLLNMKSTEVVTSGNTVTGGSNTGVTINTANGNATISGNTSAAAVFVQENTTLNFSSSATLTIGEGSGPLYVADGKTLSINATGATAPTLANPVIKLIDGKIFGKELVSVTLPSGNGNCIIDYEVADDGVYICASPKMAVMGSNVHTDGTYVTTETQTAFTGITLQQFYDGGYEIRGRFSGANISGKAREGAGYNQYVTEDGEGNVTKIRYEMQVNDDGHIKCIPIELTPNAGNTGIDVKALGAYFQTGGTLGMEFLNADGTKKAGSDATLGTAYDSSSSYCLYNLNIAGKNAKSIALAGNTELTVGTDIAAAYSTLSVSGSGKLTVNGNLNVESLVLSGSVSVVLGGNISARTINAGNGTTISFVGESEAAFGWSTLSGAGALNIDPGEGNTFSMFVANTAYTGAVVIESGTVKMTDSKAFGPFNRASAVRVKDGAALSTGCTNGGATSTTNHLLLEEGGTYTSYKSISDTKMFPFSKLTLEGDAFVKANDGNVGITLHWNYPTSVALGGYTLTKTGAQPFYLSSATITGTGMIHVKEGELYIETEFYGNTITTCSDGTIKIDNGATLTLGGYQEGGQLTTKNLILEGSVDAKAPAKNLITVTGCIAGGGSMPKLVLSSGTTLKPTNNTAGFTVTGSLTLGDTINIDLSEVDLSAKTDGTYFPVITGPLTAAFDTANITTFTRGSNSSRWSLYTRETATAGTYEIGVYLTPVEATVTWSGETGTWTDTSFNGGTDNFSNLSAQTVVFADDGESTATALAVTVSGEKSVGALNFTAGSRNITLSGGSITATTVSKSGGGVAIVNNVLSGTTSISVTDGVLVLNPDGEVVSDVGSLDAGTLVIYVGAGVTRTVTESISATKIVKRGAGTLKVTAASTSVPLAIDDGVVAADSAPTTAVVVNEGGVFELISTSNVNDSSYGTDPTSLDLSKVSGSGTLKYSSTAGWRAFPDVDARMPASTLTIQAELDDSLIITKYNGVTVIGSLAGSKNIRSDFGTNGADGRILTVTQSKDTEWQGKFVSNRITQFNVVAPASGTPGTLTMSGGNDQSISMQVDGSVNLTGTWSGNTTVAGTFACSGTLTGNLTAQSGSTLDFSEATSEARISGALTLASGTTVKLPAGADLPYQIATSGDGGLIEITLQIGNGTPTAGYFALSGGAITTLTSVNIDTDTTYSVAEVFGTPSATSAYEINVTSDATLTVPSTTVGTIKYNFAATDNTVTLAGGYKIPAAVSYLKITDASSLTAGNYTLFQWTTPQQFTTECAGYGRFASVDTTGLDSNLTAEVIYGAKAIYLRVYNTATQAARKPLVIWPYGDSITEGYNQQYTGANYRILLYQKLRMLGYNVKSTGVYDLDDGRNSVDPSGTPLTDDDKWHSAKHGAPVSAGLSGLAGRGALIENVDTLCVQAETPDVVLLHIGVNDLSQTSDVDSVFEAWTNVVGRLVRNLPNSKIVVSTALYGRDNQTTRNSRVTSYNDKIKALIAAMPAEWVGHVVLADLCSLVDSNTTGILYSQDTVHPDWWGYDQMAEGWLEKIVELYGNPDAMNFPSQAALPAIPGSSELGAANKSELADYLVGFTKYGDIRVAHGQDINNIGYDNVDEDAAASNIGRVGYFVEYVRTDNHAHKWVWVDMDAFGDRDIASMGLPAATQQQVVKHMHVYSNHGAVDNVDADDDTVSGFIEFTPYNIGAASSSIEGAPADSCPSSNQLDWNDTPSATGYGTYSSMQVFRIAPPSGRPAQTIFGFNNWRDYDSNPAEFGIGNFAQHFWSGNEQTLDYVHTRTSVKMNADAYTVKTIEIWTKPEYTATIDDDADFSDVAESASLPEEASSCDLVINVTADAKLTFDDATSVGSIRFNIADGVTLTLDGVSNLTVGKVILSGPGKLLIDQNITIPALNADEGAVIGFADSKKLTVTGALVVLSGATLTLEPNAISSASSTILSAASISGTVSLTLPSEAGVEYSTLNTDTSYKIVRTPSVAFSYDGTIGATPSGWFTSWGGEGFGDRLRVGPDSDRSIVYEVYHDSDNAKAHPYYNLGARSAFSFALYADVSQVGSDGRKVLASFGNSSAGLVLYRQGDYIKVGHVTGSGFTGGWAAAVAMPASGYHLYTVTYDATGTIALYLDDGASSSSRSTLGSMTLNNGMQIGGMYQGVPTGNVFNDGAFAQGLGMAFAAIRGYDAVLVADNVAALAESFPATANEVSWDVDLLQHNKLLTVYSTTLTEGHYLGGNYGTVTVPSGETVNVPALRFFNRNYYDYLTFNMAGRINITTEAPKDVYNYQRYTAMGGSLLGHYHGYGTYNLTGTLNSPDAYVELAFTAEKQTFNVDSGLATVKGFYSANGEAEINLTNNGTIEVSDIPSDGGAITKNFGYGTFRVKADATETRAINFQGTVSLPTTLDPNGHTLAMSAASLTGNGYIKVASSVEEGEKGSVTFAGSAAGFTGTVVIDDANKDLITFTDITAYHGNILYAVTGSSILPSYLSGFAGTLTITGGPVDATGVDLSGATVNIADDCSFTADAGKEGTLVLGSGAAVTLNVTEEVANYEGYFPNAAGSGTISYYQTDGTPGVLTGADHVNGNNLMPYYNVWVPSQDGNNNTISADAAARWRLTRLPDANKNVAFKLDGDATVTIDATITFKDVQVYGTGTLTIQQSGGNVLTVGKGLYTTANAGVQIDSGLAFADYTMLEVESASPKCVAVNCGVVESPFVIPTVTGSGKLSVMESHALASTSLAVGSLDVGGTLTLLYGAGYATSASVSAGGVVDVSACTSLTVPTLTVNGTLRMGGKTLSATTVTGTGRVEYTNKLPDPSSWSTGTASSGWRGTVAFSQTANMTGPNLNSYGNANSTVALTGVSGSNTYLPDDDVATNVRIEGAVTINNGNPVDIASGWTQARVVKIASLEVDDALTFVKTGNTEWNVPYMGIYYAEVLKCGTGGSIDIGNQFGLRVDAVDFAEAPSASTCAVPVSLSRGGDNKADGALYGPNGAVGEWIPVTVNGVANGQKLVHATVNDTTGLYLAVASVTTNETTTYYPTLAAVKAVVGNASVTINLLADTSESVELAYGQVLDKGTTTYTGTVSGANGASIYEDGTTYKVRYGTIFSVY